jgi:hypothetical protein
VAVPGVAGHTPTVTREVVSVFVRFSPSLALETTEFGYYGQTLQHVYHSGPVL